MSVLADGLQSITCIGLAALLLVQHFLRSGGATGGDLLLVYWTLKLPAIGHSLTGLAHQYPAQRNVLLRLLEPLSAPSEHSSADAASVAPGVSDGAGTSETTKLAPVSIHIENGSVVAAGHCILQDVGLSIAPGEHVAIVGASGAGKSTLVGLLLGWHRLASGSLLVDGVSVTSEKQERLRRHTAWVDRAIQIWNRPFIENLAYAAGDQAIDHVGAALHAADLHGVLEKLPLGLQTCLGEGGALLSGGEGQRVRLGRALSQTNVRLVLLDEPFRGLDRGQRGKLLTEARNWWRQATLLCVTHDVGETLAFDRVLVIDNGRIVEDGKPAELAASASRYSELLTAESVVRNDMWQGHAWRRVRIDNGRIEKPEPKARHTATLESTNGRQSATAGVNTKAEREYERRA
jgi:ATP-binding cassette subfamily B protein